MDVRSCRNCGKLFNYMQGSKICPACKKKLEEKFVEVKEYIRHNDKAPLSQIAEDTDVSVKQLKQWVKEERLTFSKDSPVGIECENCGALIRTGRFCDKCKNNMASEMSKMYAVTPPPQQDAKKRDKDKIRFLDRE